jgi:nitronate monooxygenase
MSVPAVLSRLRIPVIGAPLFIISTPELVIAQCKAGVVGSFPALNARPGPVLHEWLDRITTELGMPRTQTGRLRPLPSTKSSTKPMTA